MSGLFVLSKPWEQRMAFGVYHLPILGETLHTSHNNMRGQTFMFVTHFTPKIKIITYLNKQGKILPLRFEGLFPTHVTEGDRMI
jgi:hypothetical protein